jgi:hypothetical protein
MIINYPYRILSISFNDVSARYFVKHLSSLYLQKSSKLAPVFYRYIKYHICGEDAFLRTINFPRSGECGFTGEVWSFLLLKKCSRILSGSTIDSFFFPLVS